MKFKVLTAAVWLAAGSAWAQDGRAAMLDRLMRLDVDGDGAISRAEAEAGRTALFTRLDADRDGYLSEAERSAASARAVRQSLADTDGDGRVSRAEAMARPYRGFDRLDADRNGEVSAAEIEVVRSRLNGG